MKKTVFLCIVGLLLVTAFSYAGGGSDSRGGSDSSGPATSGSSPFYTGDGGRGITLTIAAPKPSGLQENQSYLPALVQSEFVNNFKSFSAIGVLDYESLGSQYDVLLSGYFDDDAGGDLGHLQSTTHIMTGNITSTATGYALDMRIVKDADKMTAASYSGTFTFEELDNRSGIRKASLDLLQKMGVTLTPQAQAELTRVMAANNTETANRANAQTALARGVTARTEVEALTYFFQAAALDPSLKEAASRSSILNVNITSGNIGDDARGDIAWRRDWVARLTETEQYFDSLNRTQSMPYTLFYSDEIKRVGEIDYRNETVTMSIKTHLHGSGIWTVSMERALQAVYDGLTATGRKDAWQLGSWPRQGVTNLNAFGRRSGNFSVVFELLNDQNKVIGRQTLQAGGSWDLSWSSRPEFSVSADDRRTLEFRNVSANDISNRMTVRVATVNGTPAETAARNGVLQIRAMSKDVFDFNAGFRFEKGEIQRFENNTNIASIVVNTVWGDPVISISSEAFKDNGLTSVIIPNSVTSIGERAFYGHRLEGIVLPGGVRTIGEGAFWRSDEGMFREADNVSGGWGRQGGGYICIGANVELQGTPFADPFTKESETISGLTLDGLPVSKKNPTNTFRLFYTRNNAKAGTYTYKVGFFGGRWSYAP